MSDWNGDPTTLQQGNSVNMPQTSDGSMVLGYQNMSSGNDKGDLNVASGGARPENLDVYGGTGQISTISRNWGANNLQLTNQSDKAGVNIWVSAIGPGYGTKPPTKLPMDGTDVTLDPQAAAQGNALPQWMTLRLQATSGQQTIFALIGGPPTNDINAYVFGLNMSKSSGPPADEAPPKDGYYQQTSANKLDFQFNWGSSRLFIANFSGNTAAGATVAVLKG
jgi:hypothetical protein